MKAVKFNRIGEAENSFSTAEQPTAEQFGIGDLWIDGIHYWSDGTNITKTNVNGFPIAPSYAKASLPSASVIGGIIYVTDDIGGATLAFSDGTNWRRTADRAIIA